MKSKPLSLPKWFLMVSSLMPLVVFTCTMWICIRIVQKRGNTVWNEQYKLSAIVFENDISAYGIDKPEHSIFALGFTLLSMVLCCSMYFRYNLWKAHMSTKSCCSFNTTVLIVGWMHAPALVVMGWTDGKQGQMIHFPAAMLGLFVLYLYCCLNFFLNIQVLWRGRDLSLCQRVCLGVELVFLAIITVCFPVCVLKWILEGSSLFEWAAVVLLLGSTLSSLLNFSAASNSASLANGTVKTENADEHSHTSQDPLLT